MGLLKIAAKVAGSAALLATGTASSVLEQVAEMSGNDTIAGYANMGKEKSLEAIKSMWESSDTSEDSDDISEEDAQRAQLQKEISRYRSEISNLKRYSSAAKNAGNDEKYAYYMDRIADLQSRVDELTALKATL